MSRSAVLSTRPFGPLLNLYTFSFTFSFLGKVKAVIGLYPSDRQKLAICLLKSGTSPFTGCVTVVRSGSLMNFRDLVAVSIVRIRAIARLFPPRTKGIRSPKTTGIPSLVDLASGSLRMLPDK